MPWQAFLFPIPAPQKTLFSYVSIIYSPSTKYNENKTNSIIRHMKLIDAKITLSELQQMSDRMFGGLVKAVIDIKKEIMVVDASMHADEEKYLLDHGSVQDELWGINIYPELTGEDFIEFDSMINIRPRLNNFSRGIDDEKLKKQILNIVNRLIVR